MEGRSGFCAPNAALAECGGSTRLSDGPYSGCTSGVRHARCWPLSTAIICPVTVRARARYITASTTSERSAGRPSGTPATSAANSCFSKLLVRQHRTRPHRVHANFWREGLRHRPRRGPQRRFRQRIGEIMRRQPPHPLVDHIDDGALRARRQPRGEALREQQRRAQIDRHLPLIDLQREILGAVRLEHRSVIDEQRQRPKNALGALDQPSRLQRVGKVGRDGLRARASRPQRRSPPPPPPAGSEAKRARSPGARPQRNPRPRLGQCAAPRRSPARAQGLPPHSCKSPPGASPHCD